MKKQNVITTLVLFLVAICLSHITVAQWTSLQGPPGATVADMERSSTGTVYMITNQTLHQSTNNGDSWAPVAVTTPASLSLDDMVAVGNTLYGVNYSQFFKSTDAGATWTQQSAGGAFYGVTRMIRFGPDNYFAIYGWNGIYVSKDEGLTWTRIYSKPVYYSLAATASGDLYTSRWVENTSGNDSNQIVRLAYPGAAGTFDEANWTVVYNWNTADGNYTSNMYFFVTSSGKIFASVNDNLLSSTTGNSGSWVSTKTGITDTYFGSCSFAQAPSGEIVLYNSGSSSIRLWKTSNLGTSWTAAANPTSTSGNNVNRLLFGASSATLFAGSDGDGVLRSADIGSTWTLKSNGLNYGMGQNIEVSSNNRIIYLSNTYSKGYWTSTDNGVTWSFANLPSFVRNSMKLSDGSILLYGDDVYRSVDNTAAGFTNVEAQYFYSIAEDAAGNLIGSLYSGIVKSTDKGNTWSTFAPAITGVPANATARFIAIDNTNNYMYFWLEYYSTQWNYKLFRVSTAGGAATEITVTPWADDNYININNVFISNGKLYVAEYSSFYESSDFGATWKTIAFSGDRVFPITGGLCVSKSGALYITQDGGQSWNSTNLPNASSYVNDIAPVSGGFIAAAANSPALKYTGDLVLPVNQLPPYINFNWAPTDGPYGGSVQKLLTDNTNNVFAQANYRVYKTTTFASWTQPSGLEQTYDIAVDKANNHIYALTYNKILRSTDAGVTWSEWNTENIGGRTSFTRTSNGDMVFTTSAQPPQVFASTNSGTNFGSPKYTFGANENVQSVISSPTTNAFFIVTRDYNTSTVKLYRSTDRGTTWTVLTPPVADPDKLLIDKNGVLYVYRAINQLYKSTNDGTSWTASISSSLSGGSFNGSEAVITSTGELWISGYRNQSNSYGIYKTADGGTSWTFSPFNQFIYSMVASGTRVVVGTAAGIFTTDDNAATFTERSTGMVAYYMDEVEVTGTSNVVATASSNVSFKSTDSQTWSKLTGSQPQRFYRNPDGSLYGHNTSGLFKTLDNGATWVKFSNFPGNDLQQVATANGTLYFGASDVAVKYTLDFSTWSNLSISGLPSQFTIYSMAVDGLSSVYLVLYNRDNSTFEAYQILFGSAIKFDKAKSPQSVFYDYSSEKIRIYDAQGAIFETSDGSTWTSKSAPAGNRMIVAAKGYYFIPIYGGGLWLSRNQGGTWQSVGMSYNQDNTFLDITINEFNGLAYGAMTNSVVRKSANIVLPAETTAPVVTTLSPANNATNVSIKPQLSITFDEPVTAASNKTIKIIDAANTLNVIETIAANTGVQTGKTMTYNITGTLQYNKTYFVVMDVGAFKDIFNNDIAGWPASQTTWRFTTKAPPTLVSVTPANASTAVPLTPTLTATFSERAVPVNGKTLKVFKSSDPVNAVATITLGAPLSEYAYLLPGNVNADQPVKLRFDATKGVGNLVGASQVFMSGGVVTTNTANPTASNLSYYKVHVTGGTIGQMTKVSGEQNLWEITLPSIRQYFGVNAGTPIYHAAFVFQDDSGNLNAEPPATIGNGTVVQRVVFLPVSQSSTAGCSTTPLAIGNSLNFPLCSPLEYNTSYFAKFDASSFTTLDGGVLNVLTANTDWTFTTAAAPTLTTTVPADNAANVDLATTISLTFSTAVTPQSGKNLTINKVSDDAVVATLALSSATVIGSTFTFTLANPSPLAFGTDYYVKADAGAFVAENTFPILTNKTDWNFKTVPAPDAVAPTISFTLGNFVKGAANKLSITVTDNAGGSGVDPATVKLSYRGITITDNPTVATMTAAAAANTFEIPVPDTWLDELGLEFSFEAKDINGNTATSPQTGVYKAYISYPENAAPNIPASVLSSGGAEQNYRIIAIPHQFGNANIETIFNEFDMSDKTSIRLLTYNGTNYIEAPSGISNFVRGVGYWINIRNQTTIALENATTPSNSKESPFTLQLKPGWNQIGNPYPFPISWDQVRTASANTNIGQVKTFNGSSYVTDTKLNAFEGGFVFLSGSTQVNVQIPMSVKTTAGRAAAKDDISDGGWVIPFAIDNGKFQNILGGVGMHPQATAGFDRFDDLPLPAFFTMPEVTFAHSEAPTSKLTRDIVPLQNTYVWEFEINPGGESATLQWDLGLFRNASSEIYLFDEEEQMIIDMFAVRSYTLRSAKVRKFRLYYGIGHDDIRPSRVSLGKPYPNPSTNYSKVNFTLPDQKASYQVALDVYDAMGRKVRTLSQGAMTPGFYEVEWNTANEDVRTAGVYLYRLSVSDPSGKNVVLSEKIIFKK